MKKTVSYWIVLFLVVAITRFAGAETLVLYDDFSKAFINPDKWNGSEWGEAGRETQRVIEKGRLHLSERSFGDVTTDSGALSSNTRLQLLNPGKITTIRSTVYVKNFEVVGCDANPGSNSSASANILAYFFNTGNPTAGNCTNDIRASIGVGASTNTSTQPKDLHVDGWVQQCRNSDCTARTTMDHKDLGPVVPGQTVTLYMKWDKPNHRFIFKRDSRAAVFSPYDTRIYPETSPPGNNRKRLGADAGASNCIDSPRPVGFMDAFFDKVYTNP